MLSITDFSAYGPQISQLLIQLVEHESPTSDKEAVDELGEFISDQAEQRGAKVSVVENPPSGNQLILRWNAQQPGKPILLLLHMDTVHPVDSLNINPARVEDGRLYGPGALDMKAGIAILFGAVEALQQSGAWPTRPFTALVTSDEETGSHSSRWLIEELARQAELVLCLEPSLENGELKTWRKGVGSFQVRTRGRAAHAGGEHQKGINAIEELSHQILAIQALTDYAKGTTLNVGVVKGGTVSNVVPSEATAVVDLRVMEPAEAERISAALQALRPVLPGAGLKVTGGMNRPPMPCDPRMQATFQKAQGIAARLGLDLQESGTGGGSDANFVAPLGIPVLDGLGGRGEGMHSEREYVWVDSLTERAALLAALLLNW